MGSVRRLATALIGADADKQAMTSAIRANGWEQDAGIRYGVNVRKGPLNLEGGQGVDGCRFDMTTVKISQYLSHIRVTIIPELAAFKARP